MLLELTKLPIEWVEPVKLPHTTRFGYRTNSFTRFGLPSMDFVEQFFLVMYWNKQEPMESVVEIRYRTRMDPWQGFGHPIDPKLLKKLLSEMPRYRNALVDIAPGRSFLKGLCGDWVPSLDTYRERTVDSLAGSLLADNGEALAMALSFPGKVKTVFQGRRVFNLVDKIDTFVYESNGAGKYSIEIQEIKSIIAKKRRQVEELDTYISEDHQQFERCKEVLGKFGIEYDMSEGEYESVNVC